MKAVIVVADLGLILPFKFNELQQTSSHKHLLWPQKRTDIKHTGHSS